MIVALSCSWPSGINPAERTFKMSLVSQRKKNVSFRCRVVKTKFSKKIVTPILLRPILFTLFRAIFCNPTASFLFQSSLYHPLHYGNYFLQALLSESEKNYKLQVLPIQLLGKTNSPKSSKSHGIFIFQLITYDFWYNLSLPCLLSPLRKLSIELGNISMGL